MKQSHHLILSTSYQSLVLDIPFFLSNAFFLIHLFYTIWARPSINLNKSLFCSTRLIPFVFFFFHFISDKIYHLIEHPGFCFFHLGYWMLVKIKKKKKKTSTIMNLWSPILVSSFVILQVPMFYFPYHSPQQSSHNPAAQTIYFLKKRNTWISVTFPLHYLLFVLAFKYFN